MSRNQAPPAIFQKRLAWNVRQPQQVENVDGPLSGDLIEQGKFGRSDWPVLMRSCQSGAINSKPC